MNDKTLYTKGYVALITTLVVGSIALAVTLGMISLSITLTQTSGAWHQGYLGGSLVDGCVEHALQEIRNSTNFAETANFPLGEGVCNYSVTSQGGENRTIQAEVVVGNATRRSVIMIDAISPAINITTWELVSEF